MENRAEHSDGRREHPSRRSATVGAIAVAVFVGLWIARVSLPRDAAAANPTAPPTPACAGQTTGPAGVDLKVACVGNELVQTYTSPGSPGLDLASRAALALAAGAALAVVAIAGWSALRRRAGRRLAATEPAAFWICDGCHSFNPTDRRRCYHCGAARPPDALLVDGRAPARMEQRFGHPWQGVDPGVDPHAGPRRD
ncbi:MAG TPA: hypothetical protein VIV06_01150 [Candidatus Limnocylindrales bacterium]